MNDILKKINPSEVTKMPETIIRECATSYCNNAFEVENEDDQQIICGQCEIERVAQTPTPTAESEGYGTTQD